jgi:glycosyltransferase involved in cell wall biosynthesis
MRIAQLAPLVEPVPPKGYGGTELVVSLITEELVRRGHEVTLFAAGNSRTTARLISVNDQNLRNHENPDRWQAYDMRMLMKLEEMQDEFDIIHNHMGYAALPQIQYLRCPVVTTLHNNIKPYCADIYARYNHYPYVAISKSYRDQNMADLLNYAGVVYNGIDMELHEYDPSAKRSYLLFLGRLCNDKGTAEAIEIAKRLNMPLKIAGKIDLNDKKYCEERVLPHLEDPSIEYLGEVDLSQKVNLYQHAIAVTYPINFEEPFGLVMAESLAAGTPLLAFDRGSVREILSDGETAIIGNTVDELADRFSELKKIQPQTCRDRALSLFSKEKMADGYQLIYDQIVEKHHGRTTEKARPIRVEDIQYLA